MKGVILLEQAVKVCIVACLILPMTVFGQNEYLSIKVKDKYLEMRSGPGKGYPLYHVVEQGRPIKIILRRTDWYQIRTHDGVTGWVDREQMQKTLDSAGINLSLRDQVLEDFLKQKLEVGFMFGSYDNATLFGVMGLWRLSEGYSIQLDLGQVSSRYFSQENVNISLAAHPFTTSRISPFFSLGVGDMKRTPSKTLISSVKTDAYTAHVALGARMYITRNFIFRGMLRHNAAFVDNDRTFEFNELGVGLSFFF